MVGMEPAWLPRYLDWLRSRSLKESTIALHQQHLHTCLRWLENRPLDLKDLGAKEVHEFLCELSSNGYRHATLVSIFKTLHCFGGYAAQEGLVAGDPTQGLCSNCLELRTRRTASQGVLRTIERRPGLTLKYRLPIFGPAWERYLQHLLDLGYSRDHVFHVLNYNFHFHRFLADRGVHRLSQVRREHVESFLGSKRIVSQRCGRALRRVSVEARTYIESFLGYALGRAFQSRPPESESRIVPGRLLERYLHFCSSHQGHQPATRKTRGLWIKKLGIFLDQQGLRDLGSLSVRHLDSFLLEQARHLKPRSLNVVVSSLRSFLRYLFLRNTIPNDLARQVAKPMRFSADLRPKYIPWKKIQELLAAIDREDLVGKRDYAMIALMVHHGLRSREVASLRVADVDLEDRSMLLASRKAGPAQQLPLSPPTVEALRDYLKSRPESAHPEVFLRVFAPRHPLGESVKVTVRLRLLRHLGAAIPRHGAHLLRHSFAKALLDRGAKLHDIGALLGHRNLESTLVYTRVATEDMREVADNYAQLIADDQACPP